MNYSRHINGGGRRGRALTPSGTKKALPQVYLKGGEKILPEIYMTDHGTQRGSAFKWIISTMLAGVVGIGAIGTVIYASLKTDKRLGSGDVVSELRHMGAKAMTPFRPLFVNRQVGPRLAGNKGDRLFVTAKGLSTRHIIHDTFARKRDRRDYVTIKPYERLVSSLATSYAENQEIIPPFNPLKLYANMSPIGGRRGPASKAASNEATVTSLALPLSIGPKDDHFKLSEPAARAFAIVAAEDYFTDLDEGETKQTGETDVAEPAAGASDEAPHNTTILAEQLGTAEPQHDEAEARDLTVRSGDTINEMLRRTGADNNEAMRIIGVMNELYPARNIKVGQRLKTVTIPRPGDPSTNEIIAASLFDGDRHLVTVARGATGDYTASATPVDLKLAPRSGGASATRHRATLYQSLYHAGLLQQLTRSQILKLLRIYAFDTDFKRLTQPGDGFEAFYDTVPDAGASDLTPNELLFTSITVNGDKHEYFRFRTPDGNIDYYDRNGNSAKKFLMRKPVRGDRVRLASGFGYRIHPLLGVRKLHTGTDWAGPTGTPILAAGDGTVEYAGRKGTYGNYVRIRHANGYKTAYAHMRGFAEGVAKGVKVRQGQVIGYIGTTGRSTGPHLHFEVLVNNRFVNAMTIPVPRGAKLRGHVLAQFVKERDRIEELMTRDPVKTKIAAAN